MCPACDDGYGEYLTGNRMIHLFECSECGHRWSMPAQEDADDPEDVQLSDEELFAAPQYPGRCPHGREWGECGDCDYLGDLAYDAARERR
jgi:hypothetical protein